MPLSVVQDPACLRASRPARASLTKRSLLSLPLGAQAISLLLIGSNPVVDLVRKLGVIANCRPDLIRPEAKVVGRLLQVAVRCPEGLHHLPDVQPPTLDCSAATGRPLPEHDPRMALPP